MVELRFRKNKVKIGPASIVWKEDRPILFSIYKGREYLILGERKTCTRRDTKILKSIFGDEIIYTKSNILVPRDFFFI